jgi:hypothetical protein
MASIVEWREPFDGTVGDLARAVQIMVNAADGPPPRGIVTVTVAIAGVLETGTTGLRGEIVVRSDAVVPDAGIVGPPVESE